MIHTVEALIDPSGAVRLLEPLHPRTTTRALVTVPDDESGLQRHETTLLSEKALAEDWNRLEEDEAWAYLQQAL